MHWLFKYTPRFNLVLILGITALGLIGVKIIQQQQVRLIEEEAFRNEQINQQKVLLIAQKNSNISQLAGNLIDEIENELPSEPGHRISMASINKLSDLTKALVPYPLGRIDSLISHQINPELGHLFITLARMYIDSSSWQQIKKLAIFDYSDLNETSLSGYNLDYAHLVGAHFRKANLNNCSLNRALLNKANLWGAQLHRVVADSVDLQHAVLNWANLNGAKLRQAQLGSAQLNHSNLTDADLSSAHMRYSQLKGAILKRINLEQVILSYSDLSRSNLESANLKTTKFHSCDLSESNLDGADLRGAILYNTTLEKCIMTNTLLDGVIVKEKDWLDKLVTWKVIGTKKIQSKYTLVPHNDPENSFVLRRIKKRN